ncbi:hypothetical protein KEH51_02700 [[Brevibacterium] frigoritolerans]|uniref:Uncharacterized protein n=1 Tax=Peribacillus frigoritolerans TaxID=450367 RepID=A0A941FPX5_9BACI|nr:hypothetical protein [Peribacillus frigoritolerans]
MKSLSICNKKVSEGFIPKPFWFFIGIESAIAERKAWHGLNNEVTFKKVSISPQVLKQKVFYLKIKTKMIGTEGARLLREKRVKGRPTGAKTPRRLPDRPRKVSTWSGNPTFKNCTNHKET